MQFIYYPVVSVSYCSSHRLFIAVGHIRKKFTNSKKPPWYGRDIGNFSKLKKKAWNKYRKNPSPDTWKEYTTQRNKLSHLIEKSKENYENKIASQIKQNPKQFWKYVGSKTKSKDKINDLLDKDGNLVTEDLEKAEILNNHFASVFTVEDTSSIPTLDTNSNNLILLEDINITNEIISKNLKELNISKATGPDGINAKILRELADQITPVLKLLYEQSLSEGKLPHQWKEGNVIALFKKGSKRSANNYRPVSLTSICCKILEKIIRNSIIKSLDEQGLIHKDQHGFRGGRSCTTQLLEVMELWTRWFDLGLPWNSIYTDFAKAFDSVPHQRLLHKIHAYGIRGKIFKWVEDFLNNRSQRVTIGSKQSNWQPVTSGIPQGSVLGPILFTIFINDMPAIVESTMKLFADEAKIFKAIESFDDINVIQDDINKLLKWSTEWQLPLNISKCKCIHYGKNNPNHTYTMNNPVLTTDTEEKDVGVTFDNTLEFRLHIRNIIAKPNSRVGLIKRSFSRLSILNFKLLYKSLVRPLLEYCSVIWFPLYKTDEYEIEKVQRRATKLVVELHDSPYPDRLKTLNLTTLAYRRNRTDMLQVYRIAHKIDNLDFNFFFEPNTNPTRGHRWKIDKPPANTRLRLNSFSNRVINPWNKLSEATVTSSSINAFKNALENEWKMTP